MLLHLHIPRTGGKSVADLIQRRLESFRPIYRFQNYETFWADFFRSPPGLFEKNYKTVTGHFFLGLHEYLDSETSYLIIVRDPIERVKSIIRYCIQNPNHRMHGPLRRARNIAEVFEHVGDTPQLSNGQVRQLNGYFSSRTISLNRGHLETALRKITEIKSINIINTSKLSSETSGKDKNHIRHLNGTDVKGIDWLDSEETTAWISRWNALDSELLAHINKYFVQRDGDILKIVNQMVVRSISIFLFSTQLV